MTDSEKDMQEARNLIANEIATNQVLGTIFAGTLINWLEDRREYYVDKMERFQSLAQNDEAKEYLERAANIKAVQLGMLAMIGILNLDVPGLMEDMSKNGPGDADEFLVEAQKFGAEVLEGLSEVSTLVTEIVQTGGEVRDGLEKMLAESSLAIVKNSGTVVGAAAEEEKEDMLWSLRTLIANTRPSES